MELDPVSERAVDALWHQLRRDVQRRGLDEQSAEDVVQETWLRTLRKPPTQPDKLGGWLNIVSSRIVHEMRRSRRNRVDRERSAARPERIDASTWTSDSLVRRYVDELGAPYAEVLVLRFYEDRDIPEIASELGRTPATVRSQLSRGLERLRQRLEEPKRRAPGWFVLWFRRAREIATEFRGWLALAGAVVLGGTLLWLAREQDPRALGAVAAADIDATPGGGAASGGGGRRPALPSPVGAATAVARPIERAIEGAVLDDTGALLPGAEIRAGSLRGVGRALTVADASGRYRALGLAEDEYLWAVGPDGQVSNRCYAASIGAGGVHDLHLARSCGTLFLQVFEADGRPAVGLDVALDGELGRGTTTVVTESGGIEVPVREMRADETDARGRSTLSVPPRRILALEARRRGRLVANERVEVRAGESTVTWTLPHPASIAGSVSDAGGLRPGALVRVRRGQEIVAEVVSGSDGRFEIGELPPGRFNAAAFVPGDPAAASHFHSGTLVSGERVGLVFQLDPAHSVRGRVLDGGAPLAGALVHGYVEGRDMLPAFDTATTDAAGEFLLPGIPDGESFRLEVVAPGETLPTARKDSVRPGEGEVVIERTAETRTLHPVDIELVGGDPARPPTLLSLRCGTPRISVELPVDAATLRATAELPAGVYMASAWVPGVGVWNAMDAVRVPGGVQRVPLPRPGELALELQLPDHVLGSDVDVELQAGNLVPFGIDAAGANFCLHSLHTDPLRRIHEAALFPGKARYYVRVAGFADAAGEVRIAQGERAAVPVALVPGFDVWMRLTSKRGFLPAEGIDYWLVSEIGKKRMPQPPDSVRSEVVLDPSEGPGWMELHMAVPHGTRAIEMRSRLGLHGRVELEGYEAGTPVEVVLEDS